MRSADPRAAAMPARAALALALLAALCGCDTLGVHWHGAPNPPAAAGTAGSSAAAAPASPASAAEAPADAPVSTGPIAPATQRAWDDALAAMRAHRVDDAERELRALAQSDPGLAGPHANLGLLARAAGRLPEATRELERASELDARQPVIWNQLGITYRQGGRFAQARAAYERALALDPGYAGAVLNLGVLEDLYLGDATQALALYTRYLALTPGGDPTVSKWIADLRNRARAAAPAASDPVPAPAAASAPKEKT